MRAVVQRVSSASVEVEGVVVGSCQGGLLLLVAVHREDTEQDARKLADRVVGLRIFNDGEGKLNLSLAQSNEQDQANRGILAVSNFTIYGDATKSRRPSFMASAPYEAGKALFEVFLAELKNFGARVETGQYGTDMRVHSINDGPVTLILETAPKL